jgi:N-formylglutamate amidohydrolase
MTQPFEIIDRGTAVITAAVHSGHRMRPEIAVFCALAEATRLREEDPFTAEIADIGTSRIAVRTSRFEVDLNRSRESAVYLDPDEAWGLCVWNQPPGSAAVESSRGLHDHFYESVAVLLERALSAHDRLIVLDIHSYNHRRRGPGMPPADVEENPEVNLGTRTLDRALWGPVADSFIGMMLERGFDVRENVKFGGGYFSRFVNDLAPGRVCALAIEFKKTFMDEWTGEADPAALARIRNALAECPPALVAAAAEVDR